MGKVQITTKSNESVGAKRLKLSSILRLRLGLGESYAIYLIHINMRSI